MRIAHIPSDNGGGKQTPSLIVIHSMGEFIDTEGNDYYAPEFLKKIGLSAHYLITPTGVIIKCREDDQVAWHCKGHNVNSIGVEFLVAGLHTYGTFVERIKEPYLGKAQYNAGVELVKGLCDRHEIKSINTHSELCPNRKVDPGSSFPVCKFMDDIGFKNG